MYAENMISLRAHQIELLNILVKARFAELFGDLRGNSRNWQKVRLDDVAILCSSGHYTSEHIIYSKIRPELNRITLPNSSGACSANECSILPRGDRCNRIFLAQIMQSFDFRDWVLRFASRSTPPRTKQADIAAFKLPLPPLEIQVEFASFVTHVWKIRHAMRQSLKWLEILEERTPFPG